MYTNSKFSMQAVVLRAADSSYYLDIGARAIHDNSDDLQQMGLLAVTDLPREIVIVKCNSVKISQEHYRIYKQ